MSVDRRVDYVVICDSGKCTVVLQSSYGSRRQAKKEAKRLGWSEGRSGETVYDWCPKCTKEANE